MTKRDVVYMISIVIGIALEALAFVAWIITKEDTLSRILMGVVFIMITGGSIATAIGDAVRRRKISK